MSLDTGNHWEPLGTTGNQWESLGHGQNQDAVNRVNRVNCVIRVNRASV